MSRPISRVLSWTIIHLGQTSPPASSNLPVPNAGRAIWKPIWSCSEWGLPCHCCYQQRGALLPHPFTLTCIRERIIGGSALCGTFRRLPPPRRYLALYPLEPGLSSGLPPFKRMRISENSEQRLPSQLMREFTTQSGTIRLNI